MRSESGERLEKACCGWNMLGILLKSYLIVLRPFNAVIERDMACNLQRSTENLSSSYLQYM